MTDMKLDAENPEEMTFGEFVWRWNLSQQRQTPDLHRQMADWLNDCCEAGDKQLAMLVFRDAGKSTICGLYCAWQLLRDPNTRILVLAAEHQLACKMTRNIRRVLELHPATTHLLPKKKDLWAADQLTIRRDLVQRDPSVLARGISSNITGARADVIICDDVEVPNTSETAGKRDILRQRLRELSFILTPGGIQIFIGTPHHFYSIYSVRAHPEIDEHSPFLNNFKRLTLPIFDEHGRSRWPERFSTDEIDKIRSQGGPAKFKSQMLLEPSHVSKVRLDPELLRSYDGDLTRSFANGLQILRIGPNEIQAAQCWWDPAFGHAGSGDSSVVAAVYLDRQNQYYLHDILYIDVSDLSQGQDEATASCTHVIEFLKRNHLRSIGIETNGIGKFLPSLLRREIRRQGVRVTVREQTSSRPKSARILEAFDPILSARRLHIHRQVQKSLFIQEMREWMPGRHSSDDGLDAASACILSLPTLHNAGIRDDGTLVENSYVGATQFSAVVEFAP